MTGEVSVGMLFRACEALWRDVRYPVMERSHSLEQQMQQALQAARDSTELLQIWLCDLLRVEQEPITLAGVRNALFHVFDHFKDSVCEASRHDWHALIVNEPWKARRRIHELLAEYPSTPVLTSYYWRTDPWRQAWFPFGETFWQFRLAPDGTDVVATFSTFADVIRAAPDGQGVPTNRWLDEMRLAVILESGETILYPELVARETPGCSSHP
ncbi:hypothetical protein [Alicyclobacillus dauci]|uniref:Uncharacterized protein n=1 Tax=Alicyclobacillus dauci TaxID=1475485 RepID=A0ABY6Z4S5_9BACL|nr:hypothetical protein [Alicyclobacillus dauci]WAH37864.1 hypothetical protein NZD86_05010 [Alicyclobacillus dauci]